MAITPLPPAPEPTDSTAQFNSKAFAWVASLEDFVTEANALEVNVDALEASTVSNAATATTKANEASASASASLSSANASAVSATNASNSATAAASSATSAATTYDQFDDRYLGSKSSPPVVDNDGQPLLVGALYFNSVTLNMNVWGGSSWSATYIPVTGYAPLANPNFTGVVTANVINTKFLIAENVLTTGSFTWDSATTSPASITGGQPAPVVTPIHKLMRGCVVKADGSVNYYLSETNWALKADGTSSVLTGADGNVMVEIPKFYFRVLYITTQPSWAISATPSAGLSVHPAFIKDGVEVPYRYFGAYDASLQFSRSVTAVADAGGGDITITTSVQHPLYVGDTVTIAGTTSYNATYTVTARPSTTTFNVTATFVATETGTATGYVSGKNLDSMAANVSTASDKLASVKGTYPLVGLTRATFRTLGSNVGTGWRQLDFALWSATQLLYLVEYQSFYSQAILGAGNTNGSYLASSTVQTDSPHTIAGAGDSIASGSTNVTSGAGVNAKPGTSFMKYRGIENLYGNCWNFADGINVNVTANGNVHVTNNATNWADNVSTNYTLITSSFPTASGYIRDLLPTDGYFLSSNNVGGGSTTYITDYHYAVTGARVVFVGGEANLGAIAGAFGLDSSIASSSARRIFGGRLAR